MLCHEDRVVAVGGLAAVGSGRAGFTRPNGATSADAYYAEMSRLHADDIAWPDGLLPIVDWGCAIHSCIDLTPPDGRMRRFFGDAWYDLGPELAFIDEGYTFREWMTAWTSDFDHWEEFRYPETPETGTEAGDGR